MWYFPNPALSAWKKAVFKKKNPHFSKIEPYKKYEPLIGVQYIKLRPTKFSSKYVQSCFCRENDPSCRYGVKPPTLTHSLPLLSLRSPILRGSPVPPWVHLTPTEGFCALPRPSTRLVRETLILRQPRMSPFSACRLQWIPSHLIWRRNRWRVVLPETATRRSGAISMYDVSSDKYHRTCDVIESEGCCGWRKWWKGSQCQ